MGLSCPNWVPTGASLKPSACPVATLSILLAAGCGDGTPHQGEADLPFAAEADQPPAGWQVREVFRVSSVDGPEGATPFGSVRGVEVDEDGNVYILDAQADAIHVLGPGGRHLRTVGRSGGGPGEFRNPNGLLITPDHRLWVADPEAMRYTVFGLDGTLAGTYRRAFSAGWGLHWDAVALADGTIYEPTTIRRPGTEEVLSVFLGLRAGDGRMEPVDTVLRLPPLEPERWEVAPIASGGGPVVAVMSGALPVPFSPASRDRLDPRGGFWAGDTDALRFVRIAWDGGTLGTVRNPAARPRPVTTQDRERALKELTDRGAEFLDPDLDMIPESMPYWDRFWVDLRGRLWVARFRPPGTGVGEPHRWEIYGADGEYLGLLELPLLSAPAPVLRNGRLVGTVKDELDVDWVVVFELVGEDSGEDGD